MVARPCTRTPRTIRGRSRARTSRDIPRTRTPHSSLSCPLALAEHRSRSPRLVRDHIFASACDGSRPDASTGTWSPSQAGCMTRLGDIVLDAARNIRHIAEAQSHRDDAAMYANLTDEGADERGAEVVEARPVASDDRKSDRIAHHFSENGDVSGFTLDRLCRNLVRRKDEILSRRIDEPDVGQPVGQARSESREFGWPALDSHEKATILLQPSVHRREFSLTLLRHPRRNRRSIACPDGQPSPRLQSHGAPGRTSWLPTPSAQPWLALA